MKKVICGLSNNKLLNNVLWVLTYVKVKGMNS